MHADSLTSDILAANTLSPAQAQAMLAHAGTLQACAERADLRAALLRGRLVGLMCPSGQSAEALLFRHAATELGATVSYIPASLKETSSPQDIDATAQLLGRLYDAVECQGMPAAVVRRLAMAAPIPIFQGLATPEHPGAELAKALPGTALPGEKREWVLQAMLLRSIA